MFFSIPLAIALLGLCAASARSQAAGHDLALYAQAGAGLDGANRPDAFALGITGPMPWSTQIGSARVDGYWDAYISRWSAPAAGGHDSSYIQLGFVPSARFRFDRGASDWFVDAGIGITYLDGLYITPDKRFSTRWNFTEFIGVGRSFGVNGRHEISVRLQHDSNAGIRKPNPGQNFLQLRYAVKFD